MTPFFRYIFVTTGVSDVEQIGLSNREHSPAIHTITLLQRQALLMLGELFGFNGKFRVHNIM